MSNRLRMVLASELGDQAVSQQQWLQLFGVDFTVGYHGWRLLWIMSSFDVPIVVRGVVDVVGELCTTLVEYPISSPDEPLLWSAALLSLGPRVDTLNGPLIGLLHTCVTARNVVLCHDRASKSIAALESERQIPPEMVQLLRRTAEELRESLEEMEAVFK